MASNKTKIAYIEDTEIQTKLNSGAIDEMDIIINPTDGGMKIVKPDKSIMGIGSNATEEQISEVLEKEKASVSDVDALFD